MALLASCRATFWRTGVLQARQLSSDITYGASSTDVDALIEESLVGGGRPQRRRRLLGRRIVLFGLVAWGSCHPLARRWAQDKTTHRKKDESPFRLLTTRREALALYREIWRISALFDWPDDRGRLWCAAGGKGRPRLISGLGLGHCWAQLESVRCHNVCWQC